MAGIKILGTGRFIPEREVHNGEFEAVVETSDEWIETRTGIKSRHIASAAEPTWHMGYMAGKAALEASGLKASDLDMIIATTVTPDFSTPSAASIIQMKLGAVNAFAFDINAACAGFTYALDMARRYLADGIRNVLVVSAESLSQITNYADRTTCVLFGDGAGACVVTSSRGRFASYLGSDVTGTRFVYAKRPRISNPFIDGRTPDAKAFDSASAAGGIYQNGREVYKFATKAMPDAIKRTCEKLGITPRQLSLIIPHQANARIIETAVKNLGIPPEKVYVNIGKYGNTSSASIAIGLDECVRGGKIAKGDTVCVVGFGAGLVYGAVIFEF